MKGRGPRGARRGVREQRARERAACVRVALSLSHLVLALHGCDEGEGHARTQCGGRAARPRGERERRGARRGAHFVSVSIGRVFFLRPSIFSSSLFSRRARLEEQSADTERQAIRAARCAPPHTMSSPPITPTPVEPCVETEPAYWFRRVGEVTFSRPPADDPADGSPPAPLPGSARRVVSAPAAGVVAFSDGRGKRGVRVYVERASAPMHRE